MSSIARRQSWYDPPGDKVCPWCAVDYGMEMYEVALDVEEEPGLYGVCAKHEGDVFPGADWFSKCTVCGRGVMNEQLEEGVCRDCINDVANGDMDPTS